MVLLSTYTKLFMMLLPPLYLKVMLFIALFNNIYRGEHIYDNHLVLKFIPTIKTYIYMIELWLTIQLKFISTIKTFKLKSMSQVCVHQMYAHLGVHTSDVRTLRCAYIRCTHT